jgi:hypothetical protein
MIDPKLAKQAIENSRDRDHPAYEGSFDMVTAIRIFALEAKLTGALQRQ